MQSLSLHIICKGMIQWGDQIAVLVNFLTGLGKINLFAQLFERADVSWLSSCLTCMEAGLGEVEFLGCQGKAKMFGHGGKHFELAQGDIHGRRL